MIRDISNILNKIFFTILNHTIFFPFSSIVSAKMYLHCKYPQSIYPFKYPSYITLKQNYKISCELANKCNHRSPRIIKRIINTHYTHTHTFVRLNHWRGPITSPIESTFQPFIQPIDFISWFSIRRLYISLVNLSN